MRQSGRSPAALRQAAEAAMQPATREVLILALVRLKQEAGKFRSKGDADSASIQIEAYVERLSAYPGDIALAVLRDWPERSAEWPQWFELFESLERLTKPRRALCAQLAGEGLTRLEHLPEHRQRDPGVVQGFRGLAARFRAMAKQTPASAAPGPLAGRFENRGG